MLGAILTVHPFGKHLTAGRGAALVVLVAFLVSFLLIRTSARLTRSVSWWPGGVQTGGVHLHHLVWGICLMMLSGFLAFGVRMRAPWWHIDAVAFGVGVGFTLDEFALWVRLEDVYWAKEGRQSLDAVIVAFTFAGLIVVGTSPFGLDDSASILGTVGGLTLVLGLVILSAAKGRIFYAVVGLFIPILALLGALRLAHPSSPWARRFYSEHKLARSRARFAPGKPLERIGARLSALIAGAPSEEEETVSRSS